MRAVAYNSERYQLAPQSDLNLQQGDLLKFQKALEVEQKFKSIKSIQIHSENSAAQGGEDHLEEEELC